MKPAISVAGISKLYHLGGRSAPFSDLRQAVGHYLSSFGRAPRKRTAHETFWALDDVSFDVQQGEVLGILGRNGAGKSTLFKILSRITEPTRGRVEIVGRLGALLEVGTGFHPEFSGRENIYLSGAVLGMRIREINDCFDRIVDFSGVSRFIDTPVKFYSSGMYVRLAFSVAAHLRNDVLLLDEVLAVGDYEFQRKCLARMEEIRNEGRTVLFVSHNLSSIANVCQRGVFLSQGKVVKIGPVQEVIQDYLHSAVSAAAEVDYTERVPQPGTEDFRVKSIRVHQKGQDGMGRAELSLVSPVEIEINFEILRDDVSLLCGIRLKDGNGSTVFTSTNHSVLTQRPDMVASRPMARGHYRTVCELPAPFLNDGLYSVSLMFLQPFFKIELNLEDALTFFVHDTGELRKHYLGHWAGNVRPLLDWVTERDFAEEHRSSQPKAAAL